MTRKDAIRTKLQRVQMSGRMAALLGAVFQETWTEPRIADLLHTSDGMLLARHEGDCGFNNFVGAVSDWERNLRGIAVAARLTLRQTSWLLTAAGIE